jgi:hypothetical protein
MRNMIIDHQVHAEFADFLAMHQEICDEKLFITAR